MSSTTARQRRRWGRVSALTVATAAVAVAALAVDATTVATPAQAQEEETRTATTFEAVTPTRLADTRREDCGCERIDPWTIRVVVAGFEDIADDAVAAALTVTVTGTTGAGYATVWPSGERRQETSTVNWGAGETRANGTIVELGDDGAVDIYLSDDAYVIVDASGAFVPSDDEVTTGRFQPIEQARLLDTRSGSRLTDQSERIGRPAGVDPDATALAVTVTVTDTQTWGFVTAYPAGTERPDVSLVNADGPGQTRAATAIVPINSGGLDLYVDGSMHVLVDVVGWFTGPDAEASDDGRFVPVTPLRMLDSRSRFSVPIFAEGTRELGLRYQEDVDREAVDELTIELYRWASAVVTNLTVTDTMADGYLTAYPAHTERPDTSSINWTTDETVANLTITPWSDATVAYYASTETDILVDATGYFTGPSVEATEDPASNEAPGYTGESPYDLVQDSVTPQIWAVLGDIEMRTVPALQGGAAGIASTPPDRIAFARFIYQYRRSVARSVAAHEVGHILAFRWLRGVPGASESRVDAIGGHECLAEAIGRLLFAQMNRFNYQPGYGDTLIECSTSVAAGNLANEIVSTTT